MGDLMKCPRCQKEMETNPDTHESVKYFFCFECGLKIKVIPNGLTITRELCEPWELASGKDVS